MQWKILRPLVSEGLSRGATSLVIGDVKQSIYRFRNAEPALLNHEVARSFSHYPIINRGESAIENTNYRSATHIVKFNNELFCRIAESLDFTQEYGNVKQSVALSDTPGYVRLLCMPKPAKAGDYSLLALNDMMEEIRRQLRAGYAPCDIAVLVYLNSQGALVIDHFMKHRDQWPETSGVGVISDDSMRLSASPAVKMILSIMRLLYISTERNPRTPDKADSKSFRRRVRELTYRYQHLILSSSSPEDALRAALEGESSGDDDFSEIMQCLDADTFNLQSLIEEIIEHYLLPFDGGRLVADQNLYIAAFVDLVADFCATGTPDLRSFLRWWDSVEKSQNVSAPAQRNAIRVLTIHKSKGLEFPCVHIPFCSTAGKQKPEWFETGGSLPDIEGPVPPLIPLMPKKALADTQFSAQYREYVRARQLESLNVAYVAFTRASRELSVFIHPRTEGSVESAVCGVVPGINGMEVSSSGYDSGFLYTYGSPTLPICEEAGAPKAIDPHTVQEMPPYATKSRPELWENLRFDRRLDFDVMRDRGTVLHRVMQKVRRAGDIEKAVHRAVYWRLIPAEEEKAATALLSNAIESVAHLHWFDGYRWVATERTIALPDGTSIRPDRIVGLPDGTTAVIDYKFGEPRNNAHTNQIKRYLTALAEAGIENPNGYVWYITTGEIVEV